MLVVEMACGGKRKTEEAAKIYRQHIVAQQQTKNVQVPLSKSCEEEALETFTFFRLFGPSLLPGLSPVHRQKRKKALVKLHM